MLNLSRLQSFQEVVRRRSFSAAAERLGYTQSTISQQVAVLERELGVTLLDRARRPIEPTAAGRIVLFHAESLLGQAAAVERELESLTAGEAGTLRLGGFFTAWATFMPSAVAAFSRGHPAVHLELRQLEPEPALRALRAGDLDVAVVYRYPELEPEEQARMHWLRLLVDPYAVALPAGHALAQRREIALPELATERWVSPPPDDAYAQVLRRLCEEHGGFTPEIGFQTRDIAMAQPLVAAGLAVALLPELGLVPRQEGVVVRPLASVPPARSVWAVRPSFARTPAAAAVMQELVAAAASRRR